MYALAFQKVILEVIFDFFYFPFWWYSFGLIRAIKWCFALWQDGNDYLAPGIWLRNILVPMYGQYDWQGRIISFFMRLIQIIFRTAALLVWSAVCLVLFAGYLALLPAIFWGLAGSLFIS